MENTRDNCVKIMAKVMEVEESSINDNSDPDTVAQWDSLSHVQLVLELEKEFNINISPEEGIEYFTNFGEIVNYISEKIQE